MTAGEELQQMDAGGKFEPPLHEEEGCQMHIWLSAKIFGRDIISSIQ